MIYATVCADMEMPDNCFECKFSRKFLTDYYCPFMSAVIPKEEYKKTRMRTCPLENVQLTGCYEDYLNAAIGMRIADVITDYQYSTIKNKLYKAYKEGRL